MGSQSDDDNNDEGGDETVGEIKNFGDSANSLQPMNKDGEEEEEFSATDTGNGGWNFIPGLAGDADDGNDDESNGSDSVEEEDKFSPGTFDPEDVEVPLGSSPSTNISTLSQKYPHISLLLKQTLLLQQKLNEKNGETEVKMKIGHHLLQIYKSTKRIILKKIRIFQSEHLKTLVDINVVTVIKSVIGFLILNHIPIAFIKD
jgi:hypothetical protein